MVIKGKPQWLFAGTQSPPLELHQESLPRPREGEGKKERLQWREQEGCVTEMQKKTDNEVVKMMQLQTQVVNHIQLHTIYMGDQIHAFNFFLM